jgi:hypothetical protein
MYRSSGISTIVIAIVYLSHAPSADLSSQRERLRAVRIMMHKANVLTLLPSPAIQYQLVNGSGFWTSTLGTPAAGQPSL